MSDRNSLGHQLLNALMRDDTDTCDLLANQIIREKAAAYVNEAGRTFQVPKHTISDAPPYKEKTQPQIAAYRDNSKIKPKEDGFHWTGDAMQDGNAYYVLVMADAAGDYTPAEFEGYHGINVIFKKNGKVDADTYDKRSQGQWQTNRNKIIAAARAGAKKQLDKFLTGKEAADYTTLPRNT